LFCVFKNKKLFLQIKQQLIQLFFEKTQHISLIELIVLNHIY